MSSKTDEKGAAVRFPPPFVPLLALGVGLLGHQFWLLSTVVAEGTARFFAGGDLVDDLPDRDSPRGGVLVESVRRGLRREPFVDSALTMMRMTRLRGAILLALLLGLPILTTGCGHGQGSGHAHHQSDGHTNRHGGRDRLAPLPSQIETYIARLESPERRAVLQVDRVVETLAPEPSDVVADIGCGPGLFSIPLGEAVSSGLVYAVDVEPKQLDALRTRVEAASLANVVPVLGGFHRPFLPPASVDLMLVVDTYHHIEDRAAYFQGLHRILRDGGRLAVVEWKSGPLRMGPPPGHKLAEGERAAELRAAGFEMVQTHDFLELHEFEVWRPSR